MFVMHMEVKLTAIASNRHGKPLQMAV